MSEEKDLRALRKEPLRIVVVGGGTGLSALLKGLKRYTANPLVNRAALLPPVEITAVVTVTDDGGSSGRLRREFEMLPPGDIRNCMAALAEDESLLSRLFQHRFAGGRGLKGHSFGNLFLTALSQVTGDFAQAVKLSAEVLAIAGTILPSTRENVTLRAVLKGGRVVEGETRISRAGEGIEQLRLVPQHCHPLPETMQAIRRADLITLGPGSLYTSVIPNLLVKGVAGVIARATALKAYMVNLMWQPGETDNMRASDHVRALLQHAGKKVVDLAVVNTTAVGRTAQRRYAQAQARPVEVDVAEIYKLGVGVVGVDLLAGGGQVRHDPEKAAALLVQLAKKGRRRRLHLLAARER